MVKAGSFDGKAEHLIDAIVSYTIGTCFFINTKSIRGMMFTRGYWEMLEECQTTWDWKCSHYEQGTEDIIQVGEGC